jgi:hypothetical protein
MLVEYVHGVEEPAPAPAPAKEEVAVVGGRCTTETTPLGEEKTEQRRWRQRPWRGSSSPCAGVRVQPRAIACDLDQVQSACTAVRRAHSAPPHPRPHPDPTRPTTPTPAPVQVPPEKPRKAPPLPLPQPRERKLTDEWTLSSWPPAEIEVVFPVGEAVREVYN